MMDLLPGTWLLSVPTEAASMLNDAVKSGGRGLRGMLDHVTPLFK